MQVQRLSSYHLLMSHSNPLVALESDGISSRAQTTGSSLAEQPLNQRRRHSSYQALRRHSYDLDADAIFVKVCPPAPHA